MVTTSTATLPIQAHEQGNTDMLLGERGADLPSLPGLPESQVERARVSSVSKAYLCPKCDTFSGDSTRKGELRQTWFQEAITLRFSSLPRPTLGTSPGDGSTMS